MASVSRNGRDVVGVSASGSGTAIGAISRRTSGGREAAKANVTPSQAGTGRDDARQGRSNSSVRYDARRRNSARGSRQTPVRKV